MVSRLRVRRDISIAGFPPERSETWLPSWAPQPKVPELGTRARCHPLVKISRACTNQGERDHAGDKNTCLKRARA